MREAVEKMQTRPQPEPRHFRATSSKRSSRCRSPIRGASARGRREEADAAAARAAARPREVLKGSRRGRSPSRSASARSRREDADDAAARSAARPREAVEKSQTLPQPELQRIRVKPSTRIRRCRCPIRSASARGRRKEADEAAAELQRIRAKSSRRSSRCCCPIRSASTRSRQ